MYDISNADSFKNCKYWLENIKTYADENVVIALVGKFNIFKTITISTLSHSKFFSSGNKADILHVN